ncbi:hypothetical protein ACHAWF_008509 [Thalassiosira exigua]
MAGDNDLFGDSSSSDADTDDLIAAAKSQPIARKKDDAPKKKKAAKRKGPDADDDDDDDDSDFGGGDQGDGDGGLFDSSSEDEGPSRKKKLGKKRKGKSAGGAKKRPAKKDGRSMKERMEALAKKRAAASGGGDGGGGGEDKPRKKRSKRSKDGEGGEGKKGEGGYASGDSYDSETFQRTKEDDDFIDADDEDPEALKELYSEQHFEDERPEGYDSEEEREMAKKKRAAAGRKSSGGAGVDKISLSDDESGEVSATSALKQAVKRMQRKKKEVKKLAELEEEGTAFLKEMDAAADADDESIKNRRPGMKRLAMLPRVMEVLARKDMVRVLLDLDLLSSCKRWIQPLPNGSLGNVTLRRRVVECVSNMTGENGVNASDLKRSGFGKTVMTLYMHKSETPDVKRLLKGCIEQWSRPIFQKSGNMKDLALAQQARAAGAGESLAGYARARDAEGRPSSGGSGGGQGGVVRGRTEDDLARIISGGSKASNAAGNNRVRVPYSQGFQYTVRPESRRGNVGDKRNLVSAKAATGGPREGDRREALGKRMTEKSRKTNKQTQRSANISIEGRVVK